MAILHMPYERDKKTATIEQSMNGTTTKKNLSRQCARVLQHHYLFRDAIIRTSSLSIKLKT
jgi:hypothetical protein